MNEHNVYLPGKDDHARIDQDDVDGVCLLIDYLINWIKYFVFILEQSLEKVDKIS